jgi:hypothetical protein
VSNDAEPPANPRRRLSRWQRRFVILALTIVVLWWPGVRLFYYGWVTTIGSTPFRRTDFSQLSRVLPPADARLVAIYPGLPHQRRESDKLLHELFTASHRAIGGYRFYSCPLSVPDALRSRISSAMQSPALYYPFRGPKLCGGYHPDYCFEWQSAQGTFYALLCRGCHEIIVIGGGTEVHCDLISAPAKALERLLDELNKPNA